MAEITLRPDMRTAGGEVCDILCEGQYVGTLLLVYREQERISGSVQLEKESLSSKDKKAVDRFITDYIQALIHAMQVRECEVLVTHSSYDHVIATGNTLELTGVKDLDEDEPEVIWVADDDDLGDWDALDRETIRMDRGGALYDDDPLEPGNDYRNPVYYELVPTSQTRHQAEYHVYDRDQEWIAEVFMRIIGNDVVGDIHWMFNPLDEEIETVTNLVVMDFDADLIDTFAIDHRYEGVIIETIELSHKDLIEAEDEAGFQWAAGGREEEFTVTLARDDKDMLTYEIYNQREGGLPIGTATVDISRKQLTGFIDFRTTFTYPGVREKIASLVMQELDKEKDYSQISFTMLQGNKPIDEVVFENQSVH
ncbi:MAG: hypothetical protein K0R57_1704 [Paenibacillaceae bacterium]|jgi:hypothetical protein|nr:hypothetical protein [Paenibacillaceae bacterium]